MSGRRLQWSIFRADLDPTRGSEQAGNRPVLVISREVINRRLPIVAVLPLTTARPGRRVYSTEVLLPAGTGGLPVDSIVMAHQVRTVSTRRLGEMYGCVEDTVLRGRVRGAVSLYLDLD